MAASSTPIRLRAVQVVLVVACVVTALTVFLTSTTRRSHFDQARRASDLVAATQELRAALGTADAASANAFLAGGVDQPDQRARYAAAIDTAAAALTRAARTAATDDALAAVGRLQQLLPTYTGLVETARADNRQQLPLGAAYLRSASQLLRTDVATELDALAAAGDTSFRAVDDPLTTGAGAPLLAVFVAVAAVFVVAQLWLARRTRRLLNLGVLAASAVLVVGAGWVLNAAGASADRALDAIANGYDGLSALSAIRADAYDQQAFATFALVDRGARDSFNARAATAANNVEARLTAAAPDARDRLDRPWSTYRARSEQVSATDTGGDYAAARDRLIAPLDDADGVAAAFAAFDDAVLERVDAATEVLTAGLDDARRPAGRLRIIGLVMGLVAAAAAAWGIQQRINDYR